ncbi:MAG: hypothetical protein ABJA82_05110, partial [Myxococcales bacterium]
MKPTRRGLLLARAMTMVGVTAAAFAGCVGKVDEVGNGSGSGSGSGGQGSGMVAGNGGGQGAGGAGHPAGAAAGTGIGTGTGGGGPAQGQGQGQGQGTGGASFGACPAGTIQDPGVSPLTKLSTIQYRNTVRELLTASGLTAVATEAAPALAGIPDDSTLSFRGLDARVSSNHVQSYFNVAVAVGNAIESNTTR